MKHQIITLFAAGMLTMLNTSCEKDLPVYSTDTCRLNFERDFRGVDDRKEETNFTFVYNAKSVTIDTIWVNVKTMGFLSDQDRPFQLKQVKSEKADAQPGVHYVPFDNPELMQKFYYIPAGKNEQKIPIVVKRDPSLKNDDVRLYVTFEENDYFIPGYEDYNIIRYCLGDRLSKPAKWNGIMDVYFGDYSVARHQFMIDITGKKWNDDFIVKDLDLEGAQDFNYILYLVGTLHNAVNEENAHRAEQGLDVLKDENGFPIEFTFGQS